MTTRIAYRAAYVAPRSSFAARIVDVLNSAVAVPRLWARRRHDRRALLQLDDHMLRDIGFDRAQAEEMAARSFWRT